MSINKRKEEEKKQRVDSILKAAKLSFSQKGYQETSMVDIANACRLGKATLYYYFKSKEEIYRHIIENDTQGHYTRLVSLLENETSVKGVIHALLFGFVNLAYEDIHFMNMLYPFGKNAPLHFYSDPEWRSKFSEIRKPLFDKITNIFSGKTLHIDVTELFQIIWTYHTGLGYKIVRGTRRESLQKELDLIVKSLEGIL